MHVRVAISATNSQVLDQFCDLALLGDVGFSQIIDHVESVPW